MPQNSVRVRSQRTEDLLCAIAYITMLPAIAMILLPSTARDPRIRFHACQSALFNWALMSVAFCMHLVAVFQQFGDISSGRAMEWSSRLLCMTVWGFIALRLASGREVRIPGFADVAERQASRGFITRFRDSASAPRTVDPTTAR